MKKVLVVEEGLGAAQATKRMLELLGHEVRTTTFGASDLAEALEAPCDVVMTEWVRGRPGTAEVIAKIREHHGAAAPWIIVATYRPIAVAIGPAFGAGADDFMMKPMVKDELAARLEGGARAASRSASGADASSAARYATLGCWKKFGPSATDCLASLTDRTFATIASLEMKDFAPKHASVLTLSLPEQSIEFRVIVEVEAPLLEEVCAELYGDDSDGMVLDTLHETAHTVGGVFMRAGLTEDLQMTCSLPLAIAPGAVRSLLERAEARSSVYLAVAGGARVAMHLTVRERKNVFIPVSRLREGMVLARDIATEDGMLLLKAGTRMTSSTNERVAAIVGYDTTVEVADAA